MSHTVIMPRYGATMEEGAVTQWAVKAGDRVAKGEVLCEIESEKLSNELLAEQDGTVLQILVETGVAVACGTAILVLGEPGEEINPTPAHAPSGLAGASQPAAALAVETHNPPADSTITPKALQLAQELQVDYSSIQGSGRFNQITRDDIRKAYDERQQSTARPIPPQTAAQPMTSMQQAIQKSMEHSLRETAQTTITYDLDARPLVAWHERLKQEYASSDIRPTFTVLLIKAVAMALQEHTIMRTIIQGDRLAVLEDIHVGVAIDLPGGLVVPNIKFVDRKSISEIARELQGLTQRAKANTLTRADISGGAFTVSNLGVFGVKYFSPILNPGESAILGIGAIEQVAKFLDYGIRFMPVLHLSLTHDHRVINGAPAARFLNTIEKVIEAEGKRI